MNTIDDIVDFKQFIADQPKWTVKEKKEIVSGRRPVYEVSFEEVSFPFGGVIDMKDANVVAPLIDSNGDGKVDSALLVAQYRVAPERVMIELPGGYRDIGERGKSGALRELAEETGYQLDEENVRLLNVVARDAYAKGNIEMYVAMLKPQQQGKQMLDREERQQGLQLIQVPLSVADYVFNEVHTPTITTQPSSETYVRAMNWARNNNLL